MTGGDFAGQTVLQQAQQQGYTVVQNQSELAATTPDQQVLGLFSPSTMPTQWNGPIAEPFTADDADNTTAAGDECVTTTRPAGSRRWRMASSALQLLDAKTAAGQGKGQAKGQPGFFLQVEGASIDKQDHAENPCAQIGETADFDNSIKLGLDYAAQHPDTRVIVTADHAHTSQIIEYPQTSAHHTQARSRPC